MKEAMQLFVTGKEQIELQADRWPEAPLGVDQVEGETVVTAVSPGTEMFWGYTRDDYRGGFGYSAVFRLTAVGNEVKNLTPGDLVFGMGPHRSWQRLPALEVTPLPAGLAPERAVFTRLMNIGMSALVTTTARPPGLVLVTGLGIIGNLAAQIFHTAGYRVVAADPVAPRRALLDGMGIELRERLDRNDPELAGNVALVLDCSGHEAAVLDGLHLVRKRGEVVLAGCPWIRRTELSMHDCLHAVFHKFAVLRSGWEWEVPGQPGDFRTGSMHGPNGNFAAGMRWIAEDRIRVEHLAPRVLPRDCQPVYQGLLHLTWPGLSAWFDWR